MIGISTNIPTAIWKRELEDRLRRGLVAQDKLTFERHRDDCVCTRCERHRERERNG